MPSLRPEAIESLIDRYLTDDLDARTMEQVRAYLDATPGRRGVMAGVRTVICGEHMSHRPVDTSVARRSLFARLDMELTAHAAPESSSRALVGPRMTMSGVRTVLSWNRERPYGWWPAITGIALGVVALVAGWRMMGTLQLPRSSSSSMLTYVTGNGERANIILPDGSTVALNVASRLEVPADYLAGNHTLHLTGEALFTVLHHKGTPLSVISGGTTAQVLGTTFLVRHYATDSSVNVAVREGKVAVHGGATRSVVLTAAEQATVEQTALRIGEVDSTAFTFTSGVLTLSGGLLADAIPELNRWYDADIRLGDATLAKRRLTGQCAAGSLTDLTELLEGTYNVRVVRKGRILTLYRR